MIQKKKVACCQMNKEKKQRERSLVDLYRKCESAKREIKNRQDASRNEKLQTGKITKQK